MNIEYIITRLIEDLEKKQNGKNPKHKFAVVISKLKDCLQYLKTNEK